MLLNTGEEWEPGRSDIKTWQELYPAVDVIQELRSMTGWLDANPKRRKTSRGIKTFCNSWLQRCQDKGGNRPALPTDRTVGSIVRTRDMTSLDDLTHNFTGEKAVADYFLETHGQVFEHGKGRLQAGDSGVRSETHSAGDSEGTLVE